MKHLIFLIVLIGLISCKKDREEPSRVALAGKWQWVRSTGGIAGATSTPASTGFNMTFEFTGSRLKIFRNSSLISEWRYHIEEIQTPSGSDLVLKYEPYKPEQSPIINGNKLFLSDRCDDCYSSEYTRRIIP